MFKSITSRIGVLLLLFSLALVTSAASFAGDLSTNKHSTYLSASDSSFDAVLNLVTLDVEATARSYGIHGKTYSTVAILVDNTVKFLPTEYAYPINDPKPDNTNINAVLNEQRKGLLRPEQRE